MEFLQKIFQSTLEDAISFKKVGSKIIARKLARRGIILTQKQLEKIEASLENVEGNSLTIHIEDLPVETSEGDNLIIDLNEPPDTVDEIVTEIITKIGHAIPDITAETASNLLGQLKSDAPQMLKDHEQERREFQSNLIEIWGIGLDLLETLNVIALEAGEEFNSEFRPKAAEEENFVFEALTRLHARACQVTSEILALLKSGFADGAHARWRTLHEIAVVASFIHQHGNQIAEQYLLHNHIESYKAANQYKDFYSRLGLDAIPSNELTELKTIRDKLVNRFGNVYGGSYGWAAPAITKLKYEINFGDIEKAVNLDHWRPYYKLASHNVHANPKGVYYRMGLDATTADILLAGPSHMGLADPAHGTAISLSQITITLLTLEPNIDRLVTCQVLLKLVDEIGDEFIKAHEKTTQSDAS